MEFSPKLSWLLYFNKYMFEERHVIIIIVSSKINILLLLSMGGWFATLINALIYCRIISEFDLL